MDHDCSQPSPDARYHQGVWDDVERCEAHQEAVVSLSPRVTTAQIEASGQDGEEYGEQRLSAESERGLNSQRKEF